MANSSAAGSTPDPSETYLPPRLEGYEVRRCLGVGGSAAVWLVANTATGTQRALKVMAPGPVPASSESRFEIRREMAILSRHSHPHLIAIHQFLDTDQGPALLMDYAPGGSAAQLVAARGPLPVGEVVTLLTPVAQALAHLHENGVTHGDVSPGNILFTSEGMPLLSDLGVGKLIGEAAGGEAHTPGFAPRTGPSQGRSRPATDVYALGALAWYALTGRVPAATASRPPLSVLVPAVPTELMALIESALSEDESLRPSAAEFSRLVYQCADAQPVDLVASAHATVRPELRTRRNAQHKPAGKAIFGRTRRRRKDASGRRKRSVKTGWMAMAASAVVLLGLASGFVLLHDPGSSKADGATPDPNATAASSQPAEPDADEAVGEGQSVDQLIEKTRATDPGLALGALAELRAESYRTGDPAILVHVNAEGSAAMKADLPEVQELESVGHALKGLSFTLADITVRPGQPDKIADVEATVRTSGFTEEDANGSRIRQEYEESTVRFVFTLRETDRGWRITDVAETVRDT